MTDASGQTNPALPWVDLAANQPGQAGRDRAAALYSQWRRHTWWRRWTTSRSEEHETRRRAAGDVSIARELERLGSGWRVLHTIPSADSAHAIDHLVIGPGGVYTVNSRNRADNTVWLGGDTLMVDGERVHHRRDSLADATFASGVLSDAVGFDVPVGGVVVIVGDRRFDVRCQPDDGSVRVTTPRSCVRWLRHLPVEWTDYGVERIFEAARRSTTWMTPVAVAEVADVVEPQQLSRERKVPVADVHRAAS